MGDNNKDLFGDEDPSGDEEMSRSISYTISAKSEKKQSPIMDISEKEDDMIVI